MFNSGINKGNQRCNNNGFVSPSSNNNTNYTNNKLFRTSSSNTAKNNKHYHHQHPLYNDNNDTINNTLLQQQRNNNINIIKTHHAVVKQQRRELTEDDEERQQLQQPIDHQFYVSSSIISRTTGSIIDDDEDIKREDATTIIKPYHHHAINSIIIGDGTTTTITGSSPMTTTLMVKSHRNKPRLKKKGGGNIRGTHHEALQRIQGTDCNHYQQYWFSAGLEKVKLEDRSREERIEIARHEFTRHLQQIVRSNVGRINRLISTDDIMLHYTTTSVDDTGKRKSLLINNETSSTTTTTTTIYHHHHHQIGYDRLVHPTACEIDDCYKPALPCTRHCTLHIMFNTDQVLFRYCTAKFADNTQCAIPIFDITHELPLCPEHARKRDNYKLYQEAKPKKLRKKVKPSAMIRPQKRNKKRKRGTTTTTTTSPMKMIETTTTTTSNHINNNNNSSRIIDIPIFETADMDDMVDEDSPELEEDNMHMVDQVLSLNESRLEQVLERQASHLLEETDISTVLSTIQADEFSDFFSVNRHGEYETPSREETEELEKALLAVDNDVKSLEKLSQSHGLLDSIILDDTLVQIPSDVYHHHHHHHHNVTQQQCGDNIMVAQTSSFLLPVQSQSHS